MAGSVVIVDEADVVAVGFAAGVEFPRVEPAILALVVLELALPIGASVKRLLFSSKHDLLTKTAQAEFDWHKLTTLLGNNSDTGLPNRQTSRILNKPTRV